MIKETLADMDDATLDALFGVDAMVKESVEASQPFFVELESEVRQRVINMGGSAVLSFRLKSGDSVVREVRLQASIEYAKVLFAFTRKQDRYDNLEIESFVEPVVMDTIVEHITRHYQGEAFSSMMTRRLTERFEFLGGMAENLRSHYGAHNDAIAGELKSTLGAYLTDEAARRIVELLQSGTGDAIFGAIAKTLATTTGKVLLVKVGAAVSQALMSAAFKTTVLLAIKKIGLALAVKYVMIKAIVILLAAVGLAKIPIFWVLLPIIGLIIAHQFSTLPTKIANGVSPAVVEGLKSQYDSLTRDVARSVCRAAFSSLSTKKATRECR